MSPSISPAISVPLGGGGELLEARFLARPNRFVVEAELAAPDRGATRVEAHLADRGRLTEALVPGARLLLARRDEVGRRTRFQAVVAYRGRRAVGLDTQLPNRLVAAALEAGAIAPFAAYDRVRREVREGEHRFDFELRRGGAPEGERCLVEVKSAGLVEGEVALFPDAPTERGRRHVRALAALARAGGGTRCAVLFVAQSSVARTLAIHTAIDPELAVALAAARADGVEVHAVRCPLGRRGLRLGEPIPVELGAAPEEGA